MRIIQITPGTGDNFYCENCLRDNELVKGLRALGHDALMVPLYLPPTTDGQATEATAPIFFGMAAKNGIRFGRAAVVVALIGVVFAVGGVWAAFHMKMG